MRFPKAMEELLQVRVARHEKRQLAKIARKRGITVSTLIREHIAELQQVAA